LLQVLDDGRLTDGQGRTVDFRNTVIIMTSNIGSDIIQEKFGRVGYEEIKAILMEVLTHQFKPEFLNRIDETVVFHPLGPDHIKSIAAIQLQALQARLNARDYQINFSEQSIQLLVESGYDPVFGARPLKRAIQQLLENTLAQQILSESLAKDKEILVGVKDGEITFTQ